MLKLKDFLLHYGKLSVAALLMATLIGCGSGGGSDNICKAAIGEEACENAGSDAGGEDDSTDEIDDIEGQGTPDSIEFVTAVPTQVSIQGAGGDETSVVSFLVTDTAGDPIADIDVSFALDSSAGGVSLANDSDRTNAEGVASTIIQAGTVATTVRVTASVASLSSETVSNAIPISTGIADFDSFTQAFETCHVWAWDRVGETSAITARSSDIFNNPSPDGTQVSFYTEGGQVEASCTLVNGGCSATWTGQNPKAIDGIRQGRSEVLISMTGAESFTDNNSNGIFDDGDGFDTSSGYDWTLGVVGQQDDRPEPWLDTNENGIWDAGEFFVDFNENGSWDDANGLYDGPLCEHSSLCSGQRTIAIGRIGTIVMAGGTPSLLGGSLSGVGSINIGPGASYDVIIGDVNGGTLPAGTTISVSVDGSDLISASSFDPFDCTGGGPTTVGVTIASDDEAGTGTLEITVGTPAGDFVFGWAVTDDGSGT